jgi:MFS family permease
VKKVVFGGMMALAGLIGAAVIIVGPLSARVILGYLTPHSFAQYLSHFSLYFPLAVFIIIAIIGFIIGILGLLEKKDR